MNQKFKKGDRVKVAHLAPASYVASPELGPIGTEYTVKNVSDDIDEQFLDLEGVSAMGYSSLRFELVQPPEVRIRRWDGTVGSAVYSDTETAIEYARQNFAPGSRFELVHIVPVKSCVVKKTVEVADA